MDALKKLISRVDKTISHERAKRAISWSTLEKKSYFRKCVYVRGGGGGTCMYSFMNHGQVTKSAKYLWTFFGCYGYSLLRCMRSKS